MQKADGYAGVPFLLPCSFMHSMASGHLEVWIKVMCWSVKEIKERILLIKPSASARVHILTAALMWTLVGGFLFLWGARGLFEASGRNGLLWVVVATGIGLIKGKVVLQKTASRVTARIKERGDDRCLGGFMSVKSWALIAVMAASGRFLRHSDLPRLIVWGVYVAVGVALVFASRIFWREWIDFR